MMKVTLVALLGALLANEVAADVYINAFRGSNNRLDDRGRDRNNANRLFDSQNNDRGGYNVGKLSVYVGESVPISWTNQHSSGTYFLKNTEFIIQYACGALMRDGTTTTTIPQTPSECYLYDCDRDLEYGRHESYTDYQYCKATSRNKGLFTANQNLQGSGAIYTRQNPTGTRRGYECPEERDYYPYWRASIWKDIAVLTNHPERCTEYQAESFNVKGRYACVYDDYYWNEVLQGIVTKKGDLPINETGCMNSPNFTVPSTNETRSKYYWKYFAPWGIDVPKCQQTITTRDNHHGLTGGRNYYTYDWAVPEVATEDDATSCCVVRLRYNITTDDYDAWQNDETLTPGVNASYNSNVSNPDPDEDPAWIPIWERFGLTYSDVSALFTTARGSTAELKSRGYVFINNPRVDPFGLLFNTSTGTSYRIQLQLAINTNQFGRTFQDRTHCFQILDRPSTIDSEATIQMISVQGKRGNIVQVYPATEYFFVPEPTSVQPGDYVHFCWTGSNTNPENNDGQGLAGTDRSNACPLTQEQYDKSEYSDVDGNVASNAVGDMGNSYPDYVDDPIYGYPTYYDYANKRGRTPSNMAGLDINVLKSLCTTRRGDDDTLFDYGNMEELDDAGTTYCISPLQVSAEGTWNYICTRNNNFSNRGHKGILTVSNSEITTIEASSLGGIYSSGEGAAVLVVQPGMIESGNTLQIQVQTWYTNGDSTIVQISGVDGGTFSSDTLVSGGWLELWIPYSPKALSSPVAYYKADASSSWSHYSSASIKFKHNTYYAVINISEGGYYRASNVISGGALALFIGAIIGFIVVAGCVISKKCRKQ